MKKKKKNEENENMNVLTWVNNSPFPDRYLSKRYVMIRKLRSALKTTDDIQPRKSKIVDTSKMGKL